MRIPFLFAVVLLFAGFLAGCMPVLEVPKVSNPFPVGPVRDQGLVSDFQQVSTEPTLLTYLLEDVSKGMLAAGKTYQVPFIAPANHDLVLVVGCGVGCSGAHVRLAPEGKTAQTATLYRGVRAYAYHSVGWQAQALVGELSLKSCNTATCSAYVALYARPR